MKYFTQKKKKKKKKKKEEGILLYSSFSFPLFMDYPLPLTWTFGRVAIDYFTKLWL